MVLEHDTMNTYKCQHNGDVAPHACHIFRFPVKNEKVYYKWNYYKSQWKKQTFPLTFQHKDNSFSLYDTHDSKSQIIAVTQEIFKKASSAFCPR